MFISLSEIPEFFWNKLKLFIAIAPCNNFASLDTPAWKTIMDNDKILNIIKYFWRSPRAYREISTPLDNGGISGLF